jgi:uncharacterized repeat protein (TIGR01451 family)
MLMRTRRTLIAILTLTVVGVAGLLGAGDAATAPADNANLKITKTDSPDPVTVGQTLTYTITVENNGPAAATDVTVVDTLPNSVDFVSANPSTGTCTQQARKVTCHLGALAAGSTGTLSNPTITIQVKPTKAGPITNSATVTSAENDPARGNNSASATTRVNAVPTPPPTSKPTCRGQTANIVGNRKANRLVGTPTRDVVQAGRGNDTVLTDGGNDLICAGPGADVVKAGGRSDRVFGGPGEDKEFGGGGNDVLKGQAGFDRLFGGRGSDLMNGGRGNDLCRGGAGADDEDRHCELR